MTERRRPGQFILRSLRESQLFQGVALWRVKPSATLRRTGQGPPAPERAPVAEPCMPAEAVDSDFGADLLGDGLGPVWHDTRPTTEPTT